MLFDIEERSNQVTSLIRVANSRILRKNQTACKESARSKFEKDIQTEILKKNVEVSTTNSSAPSTSSIYNYLTMRKRRTTSGSNKDHKENLKRCEPVIFTNWKEISKSKRSKIKASSVISDESEEMVRSVIIEYQYTIIECDNLSI